MSRSYAVFSVLVVGAALALWAGGCAKDTTGPGQQPPEEKPPTPSLLVKVAGDEQTGTAGAALSDSLVAKVTDADGRPVGNVSVSWGVSGGGGSVSPATSTTSSSGQAKTSWTVGTTAGANTATASAAGLASVSFSAIGRPGAAAKLAKVSGDEQSGTVGAVLADSLVVKVTDQFGNPVRAASVSWAVTAGAGSVTPATSTSSTGGLARARWTLGTAAGVNTVTASASGIQAVSFSATAAAGPPATLAKVGGDGQGTAPGRTVTDSLVAKVTDSFGNPVSGARVRWEVAAGGGFVSPVSSTTGLTGEARTAWTLGPSTGTNTATATVTGLPAVSFSATALTLNLKIQALYLTQSTQTQAGSVPLVKDRNAYLRVFVTANESNSATPVVRVRFYQGSSLLDTRTISAPGSSAPTSLNEEPLTASWNAAIAGTLIQPNVSILADVDPDRTVLEADKTDNTFPASGTAQALDVRTANVFELRLVPVRLAASNNLTGDVTESNKADYTSLTGKVYPLPSVDADIRAAYSTNAVLTVDDANDGWGILLRELDALRVADNSPRYYYGVVKVPFSGSTGAGIAISPGTAAWGWDTPDGSPGLTGRGQIAAHEWAHNWNRLHSPCGSPAGPDPEYPYANGVIGVYGLDVAASALKSPSLPDIVSYCANPWISDYTYRGVLNYRATNFEPPPAAAAGPELSLLVWGGISRGPLVLEPAFPVLTRPVLPREPGPYTLEGLDAGGARLFSFAFRPADLVDGPQPAASFAFAIPARLLEPDRLAVLRVSGPEGEATRASAAAFAAAAAGPAPAPPRASLRRRAGDVVELSWDGGAYPMVMVRDPRTGLVLSFAREGAVTIGTAARELELVFSDGVQGTARRATIR